MVLRFIEHWKCRVPGRFKLAPDDHDDIGHLGTHALDAKYVTNDTRSPESQTLRYFTGHKREVLLYTKVTCQCTYGDANTGHEHDQAVHPVLQQHLANPARTSNIKESQYRVCALRSRLLAVYMCYICTKYFFGRVGI